MKYKSIQEMKNKLIKETTVATKTKQKLRLNLNIWTKQQK